MSSCPEPAAHVAHLMHHPPGAPRPAHAVPVAAAAATAPLPISRFSMARRVWTPTCTHLTVTRFYSDKAVCEVCRRPSPMGWLYLCTQDVDLALAEVIRQGDDPSFDRLGQVLYPAVKPAKRGPEARSAKYSVLTELSPDEVESYTPDQLVTLMHQRENVQDVIHQDGVLGAALGDDATKPWVPSDDDVCGFQACHYCRMPFAERAFLSLNGVANGDIPATAAVGYGFHHAGERPLASPELVENLGLRPVPLPRVVSYTPSTSSSSSWSISDTLEEPPLPEFPSRRPTAQSPAMLTRSDMRLSFMNPPPGLPPPRRQGLPRWLGPTGLLVGGYRARLPARPSGMSPVSSSPGQTHRPQLFTVQPVVCDGRSHAVFTPVDPQAGSEAFPDSPGRDDKPKEVYAAELLFPLGQTSYDRACATPLPPPAEEEALFLAEAVEKTLEKEEHGHGHGHDGVLGPEPLVVPGGVAVTEEGIELRAPDIEVQVIND